MKKLTLLLFTLLLFHPFSHAQKRTFLRFYSLTGEKFKKGCLGGITDSSVLIYDDANKMEIPASAIGHIKTKRSFGHNILTGAVIAIVPLGKLIQMS